MIPSVNKPWLKYYSHDDLCTPLPEGSIYDFLYENNRDHSCDIALDYFGRKITYGQLFEQIEKTAGSFAALGINPGDIVMIVSVTTPEIICAFYALNRLGAIANMADPRTSAEGIREYIRETNCKLVIALDACYGKIAEAVKETSAETVLVVSPADSLPSLMKLVYKLKTKQPEAADNTLFWQEFLRSSIDYTPAIGKKEDCCVIVHTGGTTGTPKGVMLSNENLNASVIQCDKSGFDFRRGDKWLGVMPPFIAYGIGNGLHLPLCMGMTLIVLPKFDPNKYDALLLKHKPNHIAGVPSHYNTIIHSRKLKNKDLSFLRSPIVGGDGMQVQLEEEVSRFLRSHGCPAGVIKGYGMTEVCAAICATAKNEFNKPGSVGIPFTHSVMAVFDGERELPCGEVGEICMWGPHVMLGYYGNEAETNAILRTHADGSRWVHSGDLGYIDSDGCVFIQGRIKRVIIRYDGFKEFPSMIENGLLNYPAVQACCVVGHDDKKQGCGKIPVAFVVWKHGMEDVSGLETHCKKHLPEYVLPASYRTIDALPLTNIGKVDYRKLEQK
mgnify:CR=1 FL=1